MRETAAVNPRTSAGLLGYTQKEGDGNVTWLPCTIESKIWMKNKSKMKANTTTCNTFS